MLTQEVVIKDMKDKGIAKYDKRNVGKNLSSTQAASSLISNVICKEETEGNINFHSSVINWLNTVDNKPEGNLAKGKAILKNLDPITICVITSKHVLDAAELLGTPMTTVAKNIGKELFLEARYQAFSKGNKKAFEGVLNRYKHSRSYSRRNAIRKVAKNLGYIPERDDPLDEGDNGASLQITVGAVLINLFIEYTGLVYKTKTRPLLGEKVHLRNRLLLTDDAKDLLEALNKTLRFHSVHYLPAVVKPSPWDESNTNLYDGTRSEWFKSFFLRGRISPMIKDFYKQSKNQEKLKMSFSSVNVLQEVPYQINEPILEVLEYLYREHLDDNNCLLWHKYKMLFYELDFDTIRREEKGTKGHQEAVRVIREREELNIASQSKRRAIADSISVAKKYLQNPEIYFPHNVDYRCRIYPYTTGISTQGADYQKSLLKYTHGVPIGDGSGPYWLAVHVANTYGNDKDTFDARVQWVHDNEDYIRRVAETPLETVNEWGDTDSPLCFLAACKEWVGYLEEGSEFITTLPIAMDGTCNGLQHYAALLGDRQLAELVNVASSDTPSRDIYTVVADNVKRRMLKYIEEEGGDDNSRYAPACEFLLDNGMVGRKLCKPPTMTLVYGVTFRGILGQCQTYIIQEMIDRDIKKPDTCKSLLGICETAAAIIYSALDEELGKAVKAMNFIKAATRALNGKGRTLKWEVPVTKFNVINSLEKRAAKEIKIYNSGKADRYKIWVGTNKPDSNRQVNASSPNFIHSLDAAHLIITIDKLKARGITQVTAIHDSYAVPAPYVDALHECIREAFAELHSYPIWEDFMNNVKETLNDEKAWERLLKDFEGGEALKVGDFKADEEVLGSKYFFS